MFMPADFAGCGQFRMLQPCKDLKKMQNEGLLTDLSFDLIHDKVDNNVSSLALMELLSQYDAVVFQRVASPSILEIMRQCKEKGIKVYLELDDALFHVSRTNPAYRIWNPSTPSWACLKEALSLCDKLILSTEELSSVYQKDNVVFHNAIDLTMPIYNPSNNRRNEITRDKKIVGWAGSSSHIDSLNQIKKPIKKLISQRDDVIFALCSNPEFMEFFDIPKDRKMYVKHKPFELWPPVMSLFDVSLATVVPGIFNACKSELKILEAGVWGVPSVCTYVEPYARFKKVSNGGNFTVYENNVNDWVNNINKLLDSKETYQDMSEKTKNAIENIYNLRKINEKRVDFFRSELL